MANPLRKVVGIYDRPHPLRRRQLWLPLAVSVAAVVVWVVFFVVW